MRDTGDEGGGPDATDVDAVRRRLSEIQESKRSRVRWNVSRKTAEMALVALEDFEVPRKKSGKARRRKRFKRLL